VKSVIRSNDLGWRAMMLAQFATLLWSGQFVAGLLRERSSRRDTAARQVLPGRVALTFLSLLLAIGLASSTYDLLMTRIYLVGARPGGPWSSVKLWGPGGAETIYDVREAYGWASSTLPSNAVVQANPRAPVGLALVGPRVDVFSGLYASRPTIAGDAEYGTLYGVPRDVYERVADPIATVFTDSVPVGAVDVARLCGQLGIRAWLVTVADPAFRDAKSWVWREPPLFANHTTRLLGCPRTTASR
jgi:hypothetical protein